MKRLLLALTILLGACTIGPKVPDGAVVLVWKTMPVEKVREHCGSPYAGGCYDKFEGICYIITPPPPHNEFSPFNHTMVSREWLFLAHEVYHCFGNTHVRN